MKIARNGLFSVTYSNSTYGVVLSDGNDTVTSLTAEKLAGRVGGVPEKVGILRKQS